MAETQQKNYRLDPETMDRLDRIAERFGLRSRADAIRLAAKLVDDHEFRPQKKTPRKSRNGD